MSQCFDSALYCFSEKIALPLRNLSSTDKAEITEIRLRSSAPLAVTKGGKTFYISQNFTLTDKAERGAITVYQRDVFDTVRVIANNSVYAHTKSLNEGFLPMKFGHRAGVTGNFSGENLCEFYSLNIRVARQITDCALPFLPLTREGGLLFTGPPSSGKTTMLRDTVRLLSERGGRVAVIDTRGEISAFCSGVIYNDLGPCADVLYGISKARGIEIALRTLSPDFIAFDEIGSKEELNGVRDCFNAGCKIIATAHMENGEELCSRPIIKDLLSTGSIKNAVMLGEKIKTKNIKV